MRIIEMRQAKTQYHDGGELAIMFIFLLRKSNQLY